MYSKFLGWGCIPPSPHGPYSMPVNYRLRPCRGRHFGGHNCISAYG